MTGINSADGHLGNIAAVGANAVHDVAHYILDGWKFANAGANLQGFGNFENGAGPDCAFASGPVYNGRTAHPESATTQRWRRPKKRSNQKGK